MWYAPIDICASRSGSGNNTVSSSSLCVPTHPTLPTEWIENFGAYRTFRYHASCFFDLVLPRLVCRAKRESECEAFERFPALHASPVLHVSPVLYASSALRASPPPSPPPPSARSYTISEPRQIKGYSKLSPSQKADTENRLTGAKAGQVAKLLIAAEKKKRKNRKDAAKALKMAEIAAASLPPPKPESSVTSPMAVEAETPSPLKAKGGIAATKAKKKAVVAEAKVSSKAAKGKTKAKKAIVTIEAVETETPPKKAKKGVVVKKAAKK